MIPQELIEKKRDGRALSEDELASFLLGYQQGRVAEEQMAALLMAVFFRGMEAEELATLVNHMLSSGKVLDLGHLDGPKIDKHSTGGVGDKVSLPLAPLVASMGIYVPMMSGRGLGHTGGTLDKLEAIPGFRTAISLDEFQTILSSVGCAMIGQSDEIAPLDKRLYALRDVTGTVASIPLITASIMSKKLAEGLTGLVLDVKVGDGAFLTSRNEAKALADAMIQVGKGRGLRVSAVLTAMDRPLGWAVGNGLEVAESVACLKGAGPSALRSVVVELASEMAVLGGVVQGREEGRKLATRNIDNGSGLERMAQLVAAQGGDPRLVEDPSLLPRAPYERVVRAKESGRVVQVAPRTLGYGLIALGGGRTHQDQRVDGRVGFTLDVELGTEVHAGDPLATVHSATEDDGARGEQVILNAVLIGSGGSLDSHAMGDSLPLIVEHRPS